MFSRRNLIILNRFAWFAPAAAAQIIFTREYFALLHSVLFFFFFFFTIFILLFYVFHTLHTYINIFKLYTMPFLNYDFVSYPRCFDTISRRRKNKMYRAKWKRKKKNVAQCRSTKTEHRYIEAFDFSWQFWYCLTIWSTNLFTRTIFFLICFTENFSHRWALSLLQNHCLFYSSTRFDEKKKNLDISRCHQKNRPERKKKAKWN